jgi:hypothetical protein
VRALARRKGETDMTDHSKRYRLPGPLCRHVRKGRVTAGEPEGPFASTNVCDREDCIADAKAWAFAVARVTPTHVRDADR